MITAACWVLIAAEKGENGSTIPSEEQVAQEQAAVVIPYVVKDPMMSNPQGPHEPEADQEAV